MQRRKKGIQNEPLQEIKNVLHEDEIHIHVCRKYITQKQILDLAISKGKLGITINNVMDTFKIEKKNSQRKLKYFHARNILFTVRDLVRQGIELPPTLRNRKPQRYYATSKKAEIIEKIRKDYQNELLDTTGVSCFPKPKYPRFEKMEEEKANNLLQALYLLPSSITYIHKINLLLFIGKWNYDMLETQPKHPGDTVWIEEKMGRSRVQFAYHPNGFVQIFIACSKRPLKLQTDYDIDMFFLLMGRIKEKLEYQLSDYTEHVIPSVENWVLKQCDINNDIPITDKAQIVMPDIQIKTAGRVFRLYVKSLEDHAVYRIEESKETNFQLSQFKQFFGAHQNLEKRLDTIIQMLDRQNVNPIKRNQELMSVYPFLPVIL